MVLDDKDIIQVDATVIVGALILLTLSNLAEGLLPAVALIQTMLTLSIVLPFATSAIFIAASSSYKTPEANRDRIIKRAALITMIVGFVYLVLVLIFLFIYHIYIIQLS